MKVQNPEHVVILGLARQGQALARFFSELGSKVTVSDTRTQKALSSALKKLEMFNISYVLGGHPLSILDDCDLLCLSGGVPLDIPIVREAQRRGIKLSNDAQEFITRCSTPVIGITGSAGKTTTTTLVGEILKLDGYTTWVGGNIGNPLINTLPEIREGHRIVMELSSFQLEIMNTSPHIAGVLNITPNHLDRHKTMDAYIAAKKHIVAHQNSEDYVVLGKDDRNAFALRTATPAQKYTFSGISEVNQGSYLKGDTLFMREYGETTEVCQRSDVRLRGYHNVLNILAAMVISHLAGASTPAIVEAIKVFEGVEHRLEEVRLIDNVLWVNDSIATAPERVLAALESFTEPLILLAGGRDKDLPWDKLVHQVLVRVRAIVVFGEAAPMINRHIEQALSRAKKLGSSDITLEKVIAVKNLEDAVGEAVKLSGSGDVVLLSPGGTSFDSYSDFAERGEHFRQLVHSL